MDLPRALRWGAMTVLAGGLLALGAAACGDDDDDDDDDGSDGALTAEEYFAEVDRLEGDLSAFFESDTGAQNAEEFGELLVPELDSYESTLSDLQPPDDLQETHDNYVEVISTAAASIEESVGDLTADDPVDAVFAAFESEEVAAVETAQCELRDLAEESGIDTPNLCPFEEEAVDPSTLPAEETTDVLIEDFTFQPAHIQVSVGDTVTWEQGVDPEPHTATADDGSFDTGLLEEAGATGEVTFDTAGEFSYFCEIHPDMLGLVTVVE
jgi:plastocyanin